MKNKTKNTLLFLLMWQISVVAYSQTDSAKVEYTQEKETKENKMYGAICDILTRRESNRKNLWKFNLVRTFLDGFTAAYERKISSKWSLNVNSVTNISELGIYGISFFRYSPFNYSFDFKERLSLECRYYYNMDRRIRLAKKSGFSGNYFSLSAVSNYNYNSQRVYTLPTNGGFSTGNYKYINQYFSQAFKFIYGIQRRIGRIGYIDVGTGLEITYINTGYYKIGNVKNIYLSNMLFYHIPLELGFGIAF